MVSDSDLVARLRDILRDSDLDTTTPSALRRQLEADLGVDLSDRKAFVREQIDIYLQTLGEEEAAIEDGDVADEQNGGSDEGEEDEGEDSDDKRGKKRRRSSDKGKVKKRGGFTKLCSLSQKLQDFVGVPVMARTEVVKKIWSYIREKDLQDPKDRRKILCDETLHNLFRVNTIDMFKMNKALAKHIMPLSAEDENGLRTENEDADESVASTSTGKEVEEEDGGGEEEEPEVEEREIKRRGKKKKSLKEDKGIVKKKGGGFTKVCSLSPQLQSFLGESELARTEVVKRIWAYIREKNLQDPKNRRSILCDEQEQEYVDEEEEEEDAEAGFNLRNSAPSHGIQPLGNLFLNPGSINQRNTGLGNLQILTDELILEILGGLSGTDLGSLAVVSKSFYVFCSHDPLWRNLVLENIGGGFLYNGSWKSTYIAATYPKLDASSVCVANLRVRDFYSDYLFQSWLCANLEMKPEWLERDNIVRKKGISLEEFVKNFEEPNKPVLLEGCMDSWAALEKWDRDYLVRVCGEARFAVGPVEMKLEDYFLYSDQAREERPLYLFDPKFADKVPILGSDYEVPAYFREDLFSVLGNERPDFRWIIMGPAGSGSSFHIDPNSTSAWNAVIKGSKKWVLFPPEVVPPGVHPSPDGAEVACPVSIMEWFMNFYGATKSWEKRPVECICKAGEVIFVPNGWWHLVINLEESIAITQNYVSRRNLLNVLEFLKKPNASTLVSGTRDRVNLHDKFKKAIEASLPDGTIDELTLKAQEKAALQKKPSFWDSVTDSKAGAFKFSF